MLNRWMIGWMTICVIASLTPIWARSQKSTGSNPDKLPAPVPIPLAQNRYFPTIRGLTWTYGGNPLELALQIRMLESEDTTTGPIYLWDSFQGRRWVQNQTDGKVIEHHDGKMRLLFDLNASAGTTWTVDAFGAGDLFVNAKITLVNRKE